jgi:hypothetical protein
MRESIRAIIAQTANVSWKGIIDKPQGNKGLTMSRHQLSLIFQLHCLDRNSLLPGPRRSIMAKRILQVSTLGAVLLTFVAFAAYGQAQTKEVKK